MIADDGGAVLCRRQSAGAKRQVASGAYLHVIHTGHHRRPRIIHVGPATPDPFLTAMADACHAHAKAAGLLPQLASTLGVSADALDAMDAGWSRWENAWTWPMRNAAGDVVGIRLRGRGKAKWAVAGGHEGLFFCPAMAISENLIIVEGASDVAAILSIGISAVIGRPSASGGGDQLVALARQWRPKNILVLSDADDVGARTAECLAARLRGIAAVRVHPPPAGIKDAREWILRGAQAADVLGLFLGLNNAKRI